MFRTIRFKLAIWYMTGVALTFLAAGAVIYQYVRTTLTAAQVQSLRNELGWFMARCEEGLAHAETKSYILDDLQEHVRYFPGREFVEIWDREGRLWFRSRGLGPDTLRQSLGPRSGSGEVIEAVSSIRGLPIRLISRTSPSGFYLLAVPAETVASPLRELVTVLLWLGPVVLIIGAIGGVSFATFSFRKINQIVEAAKRITADRLQERIPPHPADDEIGRIVSTFNEMISRLDVSFQRIREFSADASHELRTPLSVMRTQLESALSGKATLAEMRQNIAGCLDATLRMASTIDNLLVLARADAGQEGLVRERVDMRELVKETHAESILLASQKSITVTLGALDPVAVSGDAARLRQMILCLIDNAIKYNVAGGKIRMELVRAGETAELRVTDSGIGIPESEIPRIFDRFYRVDKTRSRELGGAGLGLSIVRWIVAAHGGSVMVKSTIGEGTMFAVTLPVLSESRL
jgi:heavy metal sensor kinase